ncbi:MAG TPA: 16S rRNA (cytidine(1402)-2'-O)-methyltransferase [Deltaproteobacteria bacterium]|nr:16S rRNA (cytidine(1402)-2'-O)-methyltransferase [Deltaproteobacteria bacterium]
MADKRYDSTPGMLYIVATPIGNLEDITLRALAVLGQVDLIAAEDTRWTIKLLERHQIKTRLISYHEHNEVERTKSIVEKLRGGLSVALVSNAGTPSVSDPGFRLIREAIANDIVLVPIPGASAIITALSASGLATDSFVFVGFLSKKDGKRRSQIQALEGEERTVILYESPFRILPLLKELIEIMGDRYGVISREMTKTHEEFLRGNLSEILENLKNRPAVKGEITLLLEKKQKDDAEALLDVVREELRIRIAAKEETLSSIVRKTSTKYGLPKKIVYSEALKINERLINSTTY